MQDEEIFIIDKVEKFIKKLLRKGLHINSKEQYHMSILWKLVWIVETYCIPICIYMLRFTIFHLSFFFHWKEFINCKNYWIMCFQGREQSLYESRVNAITTRRSANKEDLQEICKHERSKRAAPLIFPRTIRIRNARWTERLPDRSYKN